MDFQAFLVQKLRQNKQKLIREIDQISQHVPQSIGVVWT